MEMINERTTVPQLLRNTVNYIHSADNVFMLERGAEQYEPITYKQTLEKADAVSAYLLSIGIKKGDRIGFIIENCPEYVYYDQGLQQIGAVNVSIYPTLSEHDIEYILNDSGTRILLVGNHFLLKKILKIANNCKELTHIIPVFNDHQKITEHVTIDAEIVTFDSLLEEGRKKINTYSSEIETLRNGILPDDLSSLIYTSGTTGTPKGVMLTHWNFVSNIKYCLEQIPNITNDEVFLSFLPLSHVFERTATYHICCAKGTKMAFAQSIELLAKNMIEVKPTIMNVVPRLLEKIHDKAIKSGTSAGGLKSKIFLWALETGKKYRETKEAHQIPGIFLSLKQKIADKLVFSKIKEKTGGRLKFMISGGAALPQNVGEFFGNLGIKILEGYGLTESSPVMAVTEDDRQVYGTVGRVIPNEIIGIQNPDTKKIITQQTHESFDPDFESAEGEIILKGPNVMKGYWNKPEETASVIDADGWFHTGDVGKFYKGNLKITDRIKNMLVNSYGKNVYPTPIENTYLKSGKIEQIFLIGDKREYITAIIVPPKEILTEAFNLKEEFFQQTDQFIENEEIINWVKGDIKKLSNDLSKFERIKNFIVKRNPFTIEEGEMTPTLKTKRRVIEKKYAEEIDKMYEVPETVD
jgi:long-chain acyl-CoA synthetase